MRCPALLLILPLAAAEPLPRELLPAKAVLELRAEEDGRKVWHTRYFRIDSDVGLRPAELERFAQVADTTAEAVKAHPLPLFAPPEGRRARLSIHGDESSYRAAGGYAGSAGFYVPRQAAVVIQAGYLLQPPHAAPSRLAPRNDEDLVVHEIVHLCMHRVNPGRPQWLLEGLADYFASAHRGAGHFRFDDMDQAVREYLRSRLSPDDPRITPVPVAELIGLDGSGWLRYVSRLPEEQRFHAYATALLLVHYHLHGGPPRLQTVREALENPGKRRETHRLIAPEDAAAIEKSLVRYWKPKGLTLEFRARK